MKLLDAFANCIPSKVRKDAHEVLHIRETIRANKLDVVLGDGFCRKINGYVEIDYQAFARLEGRRYMNG